MFFYLLVLFQELNHVCFYVSTWYSQLLTQTTNQVCLYYKNWTYLKTCVFLWMLW